MTMGREWVAHCDQPGCPEQVVASGSMSKSDFGMLVNDHGWAAAPSHAETFCEAHFREFEEVPPDPAELERAAKKFAEAFAEAGRRRQRIEGRS